jgi:hypothetical protein
MNTDFCFYNSITPEWLCNCPLVFDWCRYNGKIYFASINWEESEKAGHLIFDLAYCATKALNGIFLFSRSWDKKKFCRWKGHSTW